MKRDICTLHIFVTFSKSRHISRHPRIPTKNSVAAMPAFLLPHTTDHAAFIHTPLAERVCNALGGAACGALVLPPLHRALHRVAAATLTRATRATIVALGAGGGSASAVHDVLRALPPPPPLPFLGSLSRRALPAAALGGAAVGPPLPRSLLVESRPSRGSNETNALNRVCVSAAVLVSQIDRLIEAVRPPTSRQHARRRVLARRRVTRDDDGDEPPFPSLPPPPPSAATRISSPK